jgi:hypothetical protein
MILVSDSPVVQSSQLGGGRVHWRLSMTIIFEVTTDQLLLQQYYRLREVAFREEIGISDFDGSEEPADRKGDIFVAHQGGRCIGGIRISPRRLQAAFFTRRGSLSPGRCDGFLITGASPRIILRPRPCRLLVAKDQPGGIRDTV